MSTLSTDLPTTFRRIDLELAREAGHPLGDASQHYVLLAPLNEDGSLDAAAWREHRDACRVIRHQSGETTIGHLVHGPGGGWWFHYDVQGSQRDEVTFHMKDERLTPGEYISVIRDDGAHTFRISAVSTLQAI